LKPLQ
jgi:hypothetical protein